MEDQLNQYREKLLFNDDEENSNQDENSSSPNTTPNDAGEVIKPGGEIEKNPKKQ